MHIFSCYAAAWKLLLPDRNMSPLFDQCPRLVILAMNMPHYKTYGWNGAFVKS